MAAAGKVAFLLVCLFMLVYYRLPGAVACIALDLQVSGQLLALSVPQFTLTLPGIAGLILSVGMGVDANIIISERIKEELSTGKTLPRAIDAGFEKAFTAVFDGNITVVIVAIILIILGSGSMLSFGYTLLCGVIMNFIAGVTASRLMIRSLSSWDALGKRQYFGARRPSYENTPLTAYRFTNLRAERGMLLRFNNRPFYNSSSWPLHLRSTNIGMGGFHIRPC
jgi:preprotein translocase subunit SecD